MSVNPSQITHLLQRALRHQDLKNQLALWQCVDHTQQSNRPWLVDPSSTRQPQNKASSLRVTMVSVHDESRAVHAINSVPYLCPIVIS